MFHFSTGCQVQQKLWCMPSDSWWGCLMKFVPRYLFVWFLDVQKNGNTNWASSIIQQLGRIPRRSQRNCFKWLFCWIHSLLFSLIRWREYLNKLVLMKILCLWFECVLCIPFVESPKSWKRYFGCLLTKNWTCNPLEHIYNRIQQYFS